MIFRALNIFDLRRRTGEIRTIEPGEIFGLDDADGLRLLNSKPHLVEPLKTVRWASPLFGVLEGEVLLSAEGTDVLVAHPAVGAPAWILRDWIIRDPEKGHKHAG